jgi:hypothetical protein
MNIITETRAGNIETVSKVRFLECVKWQRRSNRPTQDQTRPSPPCHGVLGPEGRQPREDGPEGGWPRRACAQDVAPPPGAPLRPSSLPPTALMVWRTVQAWAQENSPWDPPPHSYIKRGRLPPYTHTSHSTPH